MNFKSLKFLILLFIGIISFSCNKEDESILQKNDDVKSKHLKHISVEQLFQDKDFKQSIEKIPSKTKNYSSKDGETVMEHDYGFTIERYKAANVQETSEVISYTLLINRPNSNVNTVENLVINTNKLTNGVKAFIYKYESNTPLENFGNFNGNVTITPIVYNPNEYNGSQSKEAVCITTYYAYCENHSDPLTNPNCLATVYWNVSCENTDGGGGGDPTYSSSVNTGVSTSGYSNTGGSGGTVQTSPVYQMSAIDKARKNFTMNLSDEQRTWLEGNLEAATDIYAYLAYSDATTGELGYTLSKTNYSSELINLARLEPNQADVNNLIKISLIIESGNYYENELDDAFFVKIDPYVDIELQNPPTTFHPNLFGIRMYLNYVKLRRLNPDWSKSKCAWHATKDVIHLGLDAFGLIPVGGEVADLINGAIYTIEGDGLNATLSYASAVPIAGWASASTKFGLKIVNSAYTTTKIKLVWKVLPNGNIFFGSDNFCRAKLRKVLNLAVGNPLIAHHLIPVSLQSEAVIQKAAKSGSAFHLNEALNGIALSSIQHSGSHTAYTTIIRNKLVAYNNLYPNATPQQSYNYLVNLIDSIRAWIIANPNTNINLIVLP